MKLVASGRAAPDTQAVVARLHFGHHDPNLGGPDNHVLGTHGVRRGYWHGRPSTHWHVDGYLADPEVSDKPRIGHVVGHLYNFSQNLGGELTVPYQNGHGSATRSTWQFGPWLMQLDSFWLGSSLEEAMNGDRHILSHIAYLERQNHKLFGGEQASEVCHFLGLAFALIEGCYVGPSLAAGRRKTDPFVWVWPGPRLPYSTKRRSNWSVHHSYSGCLSILEPLWTKWKSLDSQEWLSRIIPIYVEASREDIPWDVRISIAQSGLDMMSSLILIELDHMMSFGQYNALHTAGQLRELLEHLGVDTKLPTWAKCKPMKLKGDLVDAVVDMRNAITHPTRANRAWLASQDEIALYHCWQVLLEYLELAILYSVGYKGKYKSCMKSSGPDDVPWLNLATSHSTSRNRKRKVRPLSGHKIGLISILGAILSGFVLGRLSTRFRR
ncbi:MAG: hypothetical protein JSS65_14970 [Armatimonadetes bacterium]|nr:hypothetical protein [Armatimonadota bacterium]